VCVIFQFKAVFLTSSGMPRILVIKPSSLGDIVHGLQVMASVKERVAGVHITWVVREIFAPLVSACTAVDEVIVFERKQGWRGIRSVMRELRTRTFDVVVDLQGLLRSGLMTWSAFAPRKLGRSDAREGAGFFYGERAPLPAAGRNSHALEILLQFAPLLGAPAALGSPLSFRSSADFTGSDFFNGSAPAPVVMFPESRRPEKCWPGFTALTRLMLQADPQVRIVWSGSERLPDDADLPAGRFLNLTGRTALEVMPQIIGRAGAVIANDSGPMHLAAALGKRTVAIFGPTAPELFGPYPLSCPRHQVVRAPAGDLAQLTPEAVLQAWQTAVI
jgi:heptosyltransferase I